MRTADEMLRDAAAAYEAGRLATAEVAYRRVLGKRPNDRQALFGLALLSIQAGATEQAIQYLLGSLVSGPNIGPSWNLLGRLYVGTGRLTEAKTAFNRATELSPEDCEVRCNFAACMRLEGDFQEAEAQLRRALTCPPPQAAAYEALIDLLRDQGRLKEAAQTVGDWFAREPTNPIARHMAAALGEGGPPARASDEYVRAHFDAFADVFDLALGRLDYRVPELVASALRVAASHAGGHPFPTLLDAGCGTGLCGPLVRELCGRLIGVDLSPRMLHHARQRGCYDEVVAAELGAYMRSRIEAFDAICCADTFVYFGTLADPLAAAHQGLRAGGPLVFTVEALLEPDAAGYRLGVSGRYLHSEAYLQRVLRESGFRVESIARQVVRQEMGRDVEGFLVTARHVAAQNA